VTLNSPQGVDAGELSDVITAYRIERAGQLTGALADLTGMDDLGGTSRAGGVRFEIEYALLHHCVLAVRQSLADGLRDQALRLATEWVHGHRPDSTTRHAVGEFMTSWFDQLDGDHDDAPETSRLVRPEDIATMDNRTASWLADTLTAIAECGYQDVVRSGVGVLVLMREQGLDQANRSWTSRLTPCTVYTDFGRVAAIFGAEIVHEATHSWLNDCLASLDIELPDGDVYFSPWKQRKRSAFGFLHATLAFSRVVNYLKAVLDRDLVDGDHHLRQYCLARLGAEGQRLTSTGDEVAAALDLLTDARLRAVFDAELDRTGLFGLRFRRNAASAAATTQGTAPAPPGEGAR